MGREVFVKVVDGGLETRGQLRSIHMLRQMLKIKPGSSVLVTRELQGCFSLLVILAF